ncbi:MAG: transposase [Crocinitomicaceae bacterium]
MAISLMLSAKKGISAMQLSRDISVNKNTAWLLQMKIRTAMREDKLELFKPKKHTSKNTQSETSHPNPPLTKNKFEGQFARYNAFGYWSLLKRAIIGQYHKIEQHYVHRYIDEIDFKRNHARMIDNGYQEMLDRLLFVTIAK